MAMKEIILIDDKAYGLEQIKNAIPEDRAADYQVLHFSSFQKYKETINHRAFIVLLDFFLDHDQLYGSQVAGQIDADYLIGFSSMMSGSKAIITFLIEIGTVRQMPHLFAIQKLRKAQHNPELTRLFHRIL